MVFFMNCIDKIKPSRGRPIGTSRPSYALSKTQVRQLLGICCGSLGLRNRAIIALGIHSGARIGTIAKLTYEQIANKDGICKTSYVVQKHNEKSKRTNRYFISRQGQQLVQDYLDSVNLNEGMPLFPSIKTGKFIQPSSIVRLVAALFARAGIDDNSSQGLRKTYASTLYVHHGLGIMELSSLLNHSSIENTRKYIQGLQPNIENAMKSLSY